MDTQQNQTQSENTENNEANQAAEQVQARTWIVYSYLMQDGVTCGYAILPQFYEFFSQFLVTINTLKDTVNKKWSPLELKEYNRFLNDVESYINYYIMGQQILIFDMETFQGAMEQYSSDQNPTGQELYATQLDYLAKVQSGYDFRLDKKNKKAKNTVNNQNKDENKQVPAKKKEEKEVVLKRDNDPTIDIAALMNTKWDQDKYTDIAKFKKENANLVFIGHVDSGKSTLTGNIMRELNEVDEQEWARNKQEAKENHMEAWELAGIADVDPNERKRGKTVEYAKLMFSLENRRFTVFDAPGHKNYVPNMIMGACQADVAVLIISAKEGEFESGFEKDGQTKQHAMLAKALGVSGFLVTVTKMGTVDWSEQRFKLIKEQVTPYLQNNCGFNDVTFVPIDSISNENVHSRIEGKFYKGPCLMEVLNEYPLPVRKPTEALRIPLIDKFKEVGSLFLYGKLQSGTIIEDQTVTVLPNRSHVIIKEIYNAKDERLPFAMAGENVKMKVKGIDESDIKRGDVLCNNLNYCQETFEFKATLNVLELPEKKKIVAAGSECVLHMHAISEQVEIIKVESKYDAASKKFIAATFLKPGDQGGVIIRCENTLCLEKHEFMPSLGRFTLRDEGKTVGYGLVNKIKPAKKLTEEQKVHLGIANKEEANVEKEMNNLKVEN